MGNREDAPRTNVDGHEQEPVTPCRAQGLLDQCCTCEPWKGEQP